MTEREIAIKWYHFLFNCKSEAQTVKEFNKWLSSRKLSPDDLLEKRPDLAGEEDPE